MNVPLKTDDRMTAEAFLAWAVDLPRGARYELLDGVVFAMSPERLIHARLKLAVCVQLMQGIADAGLPCEAFTDGMAVRVDDGSVFEPDAMVRRGAEGRIETTSYESGMVRLDPPGLALDVDALFPPVAQDPKPTP